MTLQPHRRATAPRRLTSIVAAVLVLSTALATWAHDDALPACSEGLPVGTIMPDPGWRTVVDLGHAFALRLPAGHVLSRAGDGAWFVHGFLDGAPLVPDAAISFLPGVTLVDAIAGDLAAAEVERIALGPATGGARVTGSYAAPDGTPYRQASYLAETARGVLRVDRYEGFDWDGFDAVACSLHAVDLVE